ARAEERLIHDAIHDALTSLPNRALFMDRLDHALRRSKRQLDCRFAVLFVDFDRFKVVNDSLGHLRGDELLVGLAARIRGCLRPADIAMYRAKALGRARHEVFQPGMHTTAVALLHLENDLRRAVERGELALVYQPIVRLADGAILGFEALLRWNHPQRGTVLPSEFI